MFFLGELRMDSMGMGMPFRDRTGSLGELDECHALADHMLSRLQSGKNLTAFTISKPDGHGSFFIVARGFLDIHEIFSLLLAHGFFRNGDDLLALMISWLPFGRVK